MSLVVSNVYVEGVRVAELGTLKETLDRIAHTPDSPGPHEMVCIGLTSPAAAELTQIAEHYGLHAHALADAMRGHQRAKLEWYDQVAFVVLRPATYVDAEERVEFGEVQAFVGHGLFIGVTQSGFEDSGRILNGIAELEGQPALLALGELAVLFGVFDLVVDSYLPVIAGLEEDIDQIEEQLFAVQPGVSRRIYELFNEVIGFQRATGPLLGMLTDLEHGPGGGRTLPPELRRQFRNLRSRVVRVVEHAESFRIQLQNALNVNSTLVAQKQNEDMKRISGWAAILFAPTLVGAIYGMNFDKMPELHWTYGYPMAIGAMVVLGTALYTVFKVKKWF